MEAMTKRIITACHLDAGAVDEYGTDECQIDESIKNLQDLDGIYADYVKGCGDNQLVADFQREFLHWNIGEKVVFESNDYVWNLLNADENDWDFPKAELADILRGDLSEGVTVYVHFKDDDGEDRYGEVTTLGDIESARQYFGEQGTPMENLI